MSFLGHIRYLADETQYGIAFDTALLELFIMKVTASHNKLLRHHAKYLNVTKDEIITFNNSFGSPIISYSDSDYA